MNPHDLMIPLLETGLKAMFPDGVNVEMLKEWLQGDDEKLRHLAIVALTAEATASNGVH